jgi:methyl-accepting chemotaxis protein
VKKVSDLIAEIAAASEEQDAGIQQINTAVTQMDQVVQQNASLVEEASAATESMKSQAGSLLQMVSRFKLAEGETAHTPMMPTASRARAGATAAAVPQPIQVRSAGARPSATFAGGLGAPKGASAEWKEF